MRHGNTMIRSFTACGLTAAALLACGGTAQAQRPGGIGGLGGGGSGSPVSNGGAMSSLPGANSLIGNSSPGFTGNSGSAFGGNSTLGGASAMPPALSAYGGAFQGGIATGTGAISGTLPYGNGAAPAGLLGGPGAAGVGSATGAGGVSTGARPWVSPYGALGIIPPARLAASAATAGGAPRSAFPGTAPNSAAGLPPLSPAMQARFRDLAGRSDRIGPATRDGVEFGLDGAAVVLRGRAAGAAEARALENLIRFEPGVREVRNEMTWQAP